MASFESPTDFAGYRQKQYGLGQDIQQRGLYGPEGINAILQAYRLAAAQGRQKSILGASTQLGSRAASMPGLVASINSGLLGRANSAFPELAANVTQQNQQSRQLGLGVMDSSLSSAEQMARWLKEYKAKYNPFSQLLGVGGAAAKSIFGGA